MTPQEIWDNSIRLGQRSDLDGYLIEAIEERKLAYFEAYISARFVEYSGKWMVGQAIYEASGKVQAIKVRDCRLDRSSCRTIGPAAGGIMTDRLGLEWLNNPDPEPGCIVFVEGEVDLWTWQANRCNGAAMLIFGVAAGMWSNDLAAKIPAGWRIYIRTHRDAVGDRYAESIARSLAHKCSIYRLKGYGSELDENDMWNLDKLPGSPAAGCIPMQLDTSAETRQSMRDADSQSNNDWSNERGRAYTQKLLDGCCDEMRTTGSGERNHKLNELAFRIARHLHLPGALSVDTCMAALLESAVSAGLGRSEARKTIQSGFKAGSRHTITPASRLPEQKLTEDKTRHDESVKQEPNPAPDDSWLDGLITTRDGSNKNCQANVNLILANDRRWQGVLAHDIFRDQIICLQSPPWGPAEAIDWTASPLWDDTLDLPRLQSWICREYGFEPTEQRARAGVLLAARRSAFHPVRSYLDGLQWDGVARVERWLMTYCGVDDSQYSRQVGRWWLISAVARIFEPGCKVDHVLVLEGDQGVRKSSTFQALVPQADFFSDSHLEIGTKDAMLCLAGKWIVEFSEFDGLTSRKDAAALKQYLTSNSDHYRAPYARIATDHPRQNVFGGSVNPDQYLRDETGNRRYWPVKAKRADVKALAKDRDQIWAEVVQLYRDGERWWPEDGEHDLLTSEQAERLVTDPWADRILEWLNGRSSATMNEILTLALEVEIGKAEKRQTMRIGAMLKEWGWTRTRVSTGKARQYVYHAPVDRD